MKMNKILLVVVALVSVNASAYWGQNIVKNVTGLFAKSTAPSKSAATLTKSTAALASLKTSLKKCGNWVAQNAVNAGHKIAALATKRNIAIAGVAVAATAGLAAVAYQYAHAKKASSDN